MRDDVIERRNTAVSLVIAGELVAVTCCFAGANVGAIADITMTVAALPRVDPGAGDLT